MCDSLVAVAVRLVGCVTGSSSSLLLQGSSSWAINYFSLNNLVVVHVIWMESCAHNLFKYKTYHPISELSLWIVSDSFVLSSAREALKREYLWPKEDGDLETEHEGENSKWEEWYEASYKGRNAHTRF